MKDMTCVSPASDVTHIEYDVTTPSPDSGISYKELEDLMSGRKSQYKVNFKGGY